MCQTYYEFLARIEPVPDKGGAYVRFPYDIRKEFGKGRVKAEITFKRKSPLTANRTPAVSSIWG